jgi:hypothetical protein
LDKKRRLRFATQPNRFKAECEQLGLFQTRMPRFSQVFFYEFTGPEVLAEAGQSMEPSFSAPARAAKHYLKSGRRLESACGVSDIWYHHVESNAGRFMPQPPPLSDLPTISDLPPPSSACPRPDEDQIRSREGMFQWQRFHRPQPTRESSRKTSLGSTLPGSHVLVPSSSPLARSIGHTVPQAKGDSAGKKPLNSKGDLAVDSRRDAGRSAVKGSSDLHAKAVSGIGLETQRDEADEEQTGKKRDVIKAAGAPGHADGAGGSKGFDEFEVDDFPLTSSLTRYLDTAIEVMGPGPSNWNKAEGVEQGGERGKKREREEQAYDGRVF